MKLLWILLTFVLSNPERLGNEIGESPDQIQPAVEPFGIQIEKEISKPSQDVWDNEAQELINFIAEDTSKDSFLDDLVKKKQAEFISRTSDHPKVEKFNRLVELAKNGNRLSIKTLGDILLYGLYDFEPDTIAAFGYYEKLSDMGDSYGQYMVGQLYATGLGVARNYQRALVYTTFSAAKNNILAHHTLGHWYNVGIGVSQTCSKALFHYLKVADHLYKDFHSGPPLGKPLPKSHKRLYQGGLYGPGASGGGNPAVSQTNDPTLQESDLLLLYKIQAEAGDPGSQYMLGQFYYAGTDTLEIDYSKAHFYFQLAAKQHPGKIAKEQDSVQYKNAAKAASESAGLLGKMYWRGEGVEVNEEIARKWFERGSSQENAPSNTYLAKMYREGKGGLEKSEVKYRQYLEKGASMGHLYGKVVLAELLMEDVEPDWKSIKTLLEDAASRGSILGHYNLGKLYSENRPGIKQNCKTAVFHVRQFIEKAHLHDFDLTAAVIDRKREKEYSLFVHYLMAAERGFLVAQVNAAYMLDMKNIQLYERNDFNRYEHALTLYLRAANQGDIDSRVRVGDLYFYGLGVDPQDQSEPKLSRSPVVKLSQLITRYMYPNESLHPNYELAVKHYVAAAEGEYTFSSIAMFNLGYAYEYGLGVEQDYHLSKRWYDSAMTTNPGSFLPVQIASFILHLKWVFKEFFKGLLNLYDYGVFRVDVVQEEFPVPGDFAEQPVQSNHGVGKTAIVLACLLLGYLVFYRNQLLRTLQQPRVQPDTFNNVNPLHGPGPVAFNTLQDTGPDVPLSTVEAIEMAEMSALLAGEPSQQNQEEESPDNSVPPIDPIE